MASSHQQLLDSLTAHIALYHSSPTNPPATSNPRSALLRWFSSLSVAHRRAALTVVDADLVQILLLMLSRLRRLGHGFFFLLPDLPSASTSSSSSSSLPSLCFRRSHGLLARTAAADSAERSVAESVLLFSSREGDEADAATDCPLDSVTVAEDLVLDVDRFVEVMDRMSGGRFLRVDESGLAAPWPELSWLKDKGYYSLEAFVANRLEVALRLSWLSCNGSKKQKGGKVAMTKEKAGVAGVAANAFWRKKGCLDWWAALDTGVRKKILQTFLAKAATPLAGKISKRSKLSLMDELASPKIDGEFQRRYGPSAYWQRGKSSSLNINSDFCLGIIATSSLGREQQTLTKYLKFLLAVQNILSILTHYTSETSENKDSTIFFSTLGSVDTIYDCVLRKLRGLIMSISIKYINEELLEDTKVKTIQNRSQENQSAGGRKGKVKSRNSRNSNSGAKACKAVSMSHEHLTEHDGRILYSDNCKSALCPSGNSLSTSNKKGGKANSGNQKDAEAGNLTELAVVFSDCKGSSGKKKHRKKGAKSRISIPKEVRPFVSQKGKADLENFIGIDELAEEVAHDNPSNLSACIDNISPVHNSNNSYNNPIVLHNDESNKSQTHIASGQVSSTSATAESMPQKSEGALNQTICLEGDILHSIDSIECLGKENGSQTIDRPLPTCYPKGEINDNKKKYHSAGHISCAAKLLAAPPNEILNFSEDDSSVVQNEYRITGCTVSGPHKFGITTSLNSSSANSQNLPAATDRLHLEVGHKCPSFFHQPFLSSRHQARGSSAESGHSHMLPSLTLPMSFDWPPMVKSWSHLSQTVTVYDSGHDPRLQSSFSAGFASHGMQHGGGNYSENDLRHFGDILDPYDMKNTSDFADDAESYWFSEEESESHVLSGRDYNQVFGGGLMYWSPAEYAGTGFSRPPSHSSDDSAWAWHEADLNRAIDDMVGMPGLSAPYNANGMASPPAVPFCSNMDPLGHAVTGSDITGKALNSSSVENPDEKISKSHTNSTGGVEGVKGDTLQYSLLRPIIVPRMSRRGSRSEFKPGYDHKSPCIPSTRRETPRIKRPPSPVVLCVPRVPRPPPPSPVGESRKRGFPIVRSGSSSPRHWGLRSWYSDESNTEETRLCLDGPEVVWPSWGRKGLTTSPIVQSIHGSLLSDHLISIPPLARDQEHPDVALPLHPPDLLNSTSKKTAISAMQTILHEEIDFFSKQVAAENLVRKPYINWAVKRVTRSLQVLWPRSRTNVFGSNATGLSLPTSDVDLVVSLPPVRNLEPIKEAGILEGRNGIKETCLQHAARYLGNQEWVRSDSLKTVENTAIPVIMLVAEVPGDIDLSSENSSVVDIPRGHLARLTKKHGDDPHFDFPGSEIASWPNNSSLRKDGIGNGKFIRLDISFKSPSHTGLQTSELVRELTQQFPASVPLALILKKFLADRTLDHAYSGGLSSYCLVLLIIRFLQHEHHIGRPNNQNLGGLLMDFLYFFGYVFDPRQMRVSIQGSGIYMNRERGLSIDPIHIDDPLYPTNNVGRNCFRIHQCIKAFADAYLVLENELPHFSADPTQKSTGKFGLLSRIVPSILLE